jgi:ATP-dependent 26S proteasome regulatory subunit
MKRKRTIRDDTRHSRDATWEWRKNYRVWDASRQIYVYPENWIEPDLVLPNACLVSLRQVVTAVRVRLGPRDKRRRTRGLTRPQGVRVRLIGKRPAGALVTAQYLASALRMDLYRIDLSSVVSKYIGETEKQLRRVFGAAGKRVAVLFFDEADALFGKRTGVKNSHDRYLNIEANYLLQQLEDYRGLAILSAGSRRGLDEALRDRFDFVIRVPPPRRRRGPGGT